MLFYMVENNVGKGEKEIKFNDGKGGNAGNQHFLLFHHCVQIIFFFLENGFYKVENIDGKGENAGYQHFLLFPSMFLNPFLQRLV